MCLSLWYGRGFVDLLKMNWWCSEGSSKETVSRLYIQCPAVLHNALLPWVLLCMGMHADSNIYKLLYIPFLHYIRDYIYLLCDRWNYMLICWSTGRHWMVTRFPEDQFVVVFEYIWCACMCRTWYISLYVPVDYANVLVVLVVRLHVWLLSCVFHVWHKGCN